MKVLSTSYSPKQRGNMHCADQGLVYFSNTF